MRQILFALKYLHEKGYAHRAIQPDHIILVKLDKSNNYLVKLIGFGSAIRVGARELVSNFGMKDPIYAAP